MEGRHNVINSFLYVKKFEVSLIKLRLLYRLVCKGFYNSYTEKAVLYLLVELTYLLS